MDFKQELLKKTEYIDSKLEDYKPSEDTAAITVYKAMNYSLDAGGKRLRPILLMEAYRMCGADDEKFVPFAVSMEMIHTYSLIHDDLPALDNDDLRRGKPSNHKVFGEAMAILAGDALLNYSYEIMSEAVINSDDPRSFAKALYTISNAAGIYKMIAGQVVDVECEGKNIDIQTLNFIHNNKTMAMIKGAVVSGGILAGASDEEIESLSIYGESIGLAFQIVDDILDIVGDEEILGKRIGSDLENKKSTYPSMFGIEKSQKMAEELIARAKSSISVFGEKAEFLEELADYIIHRRK